VRFPNHDVRQVVLITMTARRPVAILVNVFTYKIAMLQFVYEPIMRRFNEPCLDRQIYSGHQQHKDWLSIREWRISPNSHHSLISTCENASILSIRQMLQSATRGTTHNRLLNTNDVLTALAGSRTVSVSDGQPYVSYVYTGRSFAIFCIAMISPWIALSMYFSINIANRKCRYNNCLCISCGYPISHHKHYICSECGKRGDLV
jgi:hypothetical protein